MTKTFRYLQERVELTCDCELGSKGERARVDAFHENYKYMTLVFPDRTHNMTVNTGTDYLYLRTVK